MGEPSISSSAEPPQGPRRGAEAGLVISHLFEAPSAEARSLAEDSGLWSLRRAPRPGWLAGRPGRRLFHWGLGPVLADFQKAFLDEGLDRHLAEEEVELFSFDLGPAARRHLGLLPLAGPLKASDIFRYSAAALKFVRRHYKGPMAAENYNFYPTGLYGLVTEPDFIAAYLDEFGLGLTLDLAHGAVTAHNLGLEIEEYLLALPLEKTAEIHISRPWLPPEGPLWAVDAHQPPGAREWNWLAKLLKSGRLPAGVPVFVEYYRDLSKLKEAHSRLQQVLGGRSAHGSVSKTR